MRKIATLAIALASLVPLAPPSGAAGEGLTLHLKRHHRPGAPVIVVLQNATDEPQHFETPWQITRAKTHEVVAQFHWSRNDRRLAPDENAIWEWDQREGTQSSEPAPPEQGDRVGPGGYILTIGAGADRIRKRFHIGRFFTLGFEGRPAASFTVFVNEARPIKLMKAEAKADDKTLIVSGKVREARRYNDDWSYSMGPGSIVLGEVFVEVCDGSPGYVERHKEEWLGERWCPWSSYVDKIGR